MARYDSVYNEIRAALIECGARCMWAAKLSDFGWQGGDHGEIEFWLSSNGRRDLLLWHHAEGVICYRACSESIKTVDEIAAVKEWMED